MKTRRGYHLIDTILPWTRAPQQKYADGIPPRVQIVCSQHTRASPVQVVAILRQQPQAEAVQGRVDALRHRAPDPDY